MLSRAASPAAAAAGRHGSINVNSQGWAEFGLHRCRYGVATALFSDPPSMKQAPIKPHPASDAPEKGSSMQRGDLIPWQAAWCTRPGNRKVANDLSRRRT